MFGAQTMITFACFRYEVCSLHTLITELECTLLCCLPSFFSPSLMKQHLKVGLGSRFHSPHAVLVTPQVQLAGGTCSPAHNCAFIGIHNFSTVYVVLRSCRWRDRAYEYELITCAQRLDSFCICDRQHRCEISKSVDVCRWLL